MFESGQVRPIARAPHRPLVFAVNTPDNRLEVLALIGRHLIPVASVKVGLEPVAVAARSDDEVWVVNHLSDSISVVDVSDPLAPKVVRTLLVGDEPRDVVFAGPGRRRAFITTARRGQNSPVDPALTTPGLGRANVWVFDADHLGAGMGGTPLTILTLFSDTPRALAVTPDGRTVYAAGFRTGNRTTTVFSLVFDFGLLGLTQQGPATDAHGAPAPSVGQIAQFDGAAWRDESGRDLSGGVFFNLPDKDVFAIDAMANPPAPRAGPTAEVSGVGTILYNMAVNPVSGKVYVSNTEARNVHRFEGEGVFAGQTVRGHHNDNRITVIDGGVASPRRLNQHIDYGTCCAPLPNPENARSLAIPTGLAVSRDGQTLFMAALGSGKIARIPTAQLEADSYAQDPGDQLAVTGGGPSGLLLDDGRDLLLVATRFDNGISVIDTRHWRETQHVTLPSPEPASVVTGRRFLYDAAFSSSHGDSACATCHVDGDLDALAWDLGNPDAMMVADGNPLTVDLVPPFPAVFHGMKGPLTTQSLRGMANHGPQHWRGDRTGADLGPSVQPNGGAYDEVEAFRQFDVAFPGLLGRAEMIPAADMAAFGQFALQIMYPPNPIRALDNSLTPLEAQGKDIFTNRVTDAFSTCNGCHVLDPDGNRQFPEERFPGFFGTDGRSSRVPGRPQVVKVPHFRNLYQKVGMFGQIMPPPIFLPLPGYDGFMGDQIRGFGFLSAGDFDTIAHFMSASAFSESDPFNSNPEGFTDVGERRAVEAFLLAFDSNLAPIVGQQITVRGPGDTAALARVALMRSRADADECDLVIAAGGGARERGYLYVGSARYAPDRAGRPPVTEAELVWRAAFARAPLTFTCAPPGSGLRIGLDRDDDGVLDGDDRDHGHCVGEAWLP
ncbi:MAG: hypothetical protein IPL61_14560 [Myxococcales bacterium]|nr:hypothetical protein [Myxococcales bacterium]